MRSTNPTLSDKAFDRVTSGQATFDSSFRSDGSPYGDPRTSGPLIQTDVFTVEGVTYKTMALLALAVLVGVAAVALAPPSAYVGIAIAGFVISLPLGLLSAFKPQWIKITAPLYAAGEGLLLGGISGLAEQAYPGVAFQAAVGTAVVLAVMLGLYRAGIIKVTQRFRMIVVTATIAIGITYVLSFVLGFFGINFGFLHGNGPLSILISVVILGIASLNLALDFDFIERGVQSRAPKDLEWYAAFGLLATLVWIYLEILRLLVKLQSRD